MNKKKLLLVTRNFPPLVGGMEKLNFNIFQSLLSEFEVYVSGPTGSHKYHNSADFSEFSPSPLWLYLISSLFKTLMFSKRIKPNIVFCGSGAAILAGYFAAKFTGAKLVCYLHGLDIIADSFVYQTFFVPLIKNSDLILVNSRHSQGLAIKSGVNSNLIKVLTPGTSIPLDAARESMVKRFRSEYDLLDDPFILIAGRITRRKGILEFIKNVMSELRTINPKLKLVVVGDEALYAMKRSSGLKEEISSCIFKLGLEKNVFLLGGVKDETLSAAFFSAELLVFPILDIPSDVEGFGMIAIEAAAHGLPTVGFAVGGVPDAIAEGESGWLVPSGDYASMKNIIINRLSSPQALSANQESCIEFAKKNGWDIFERKLVTLLQEKIIS